MAKIVLDDFNGGLCPGWYNFSGTEIDTVTYAAQNQHFFGYSVPFIRSAYGFIVPGNERFTAVTGVGALANARIPTCIAIDDNNSNVDSTSGTSFYFAQNNKFFALDPTLDTIESTGGYPVTLTHGAHTGLVVDRIIQFGQDSGVPTIHVFGRDATDAFGGIYDKTNGYSEDGLQGDTTNWPTCAFNINSPIIACVADNTRMYLAQDNKIHMVDGLGTDVTLNQLYPEVFVLETTARIVDMVDAYGKLWILRAPWHSKASTSSGLQTFSTQRKISVIVWNRNDTVVAAEDSIVLEDCNDASYLFVSNGTIFAFVNGADNVNQLRYYDGRNFVLAAELGSGDDGIPGCKDAICSYMGGILWQDFDGKLFWYGKLLGAQTSGLFLLGRNQSADAGSGGFIIPKKSGILYLASIVSSVGKIYKWNPLDTSATNGGEYYSIGNIQLPKLSTVNSVTLYFRKTTNADTGTSSVDIFSNSGTTSVTATIDHDVDIPRGFKYIPLNLEATNVMGMRFTWGNSATLANLPNIYRIEIDYTPTTRLK